MIVPSLLLAPLENRKAKGKPRGDIPIEATKALTQLSDELPPLTGSFQAQGNVDENLWASLEQLDVQSAEAQGEL